LISAFLVNVESAAREQDPVGLGLARANADAVALLPAANAALDILLREHILAARRTFLGDPGDAGYETRPMCVGFVDLVGSTALARQLSTRELGAALTEFETVAADTVTSGGGRLVKLIGDEVLYTANDEASACTIALSLAATFKEHAVLPPVRAGVAAGDVLLRDGDVYGPVVNLAARAVKVAEAGEVVTSPTVAAAAGITAKPLDRYELKGFDDDVALCRLLPPGRLG
jgi:adenylate cyclase